mgnify:CR=1 FL=1
MSLKRIWLTFSLILLLIPAPALAGGRTETIQEEYTEYIWSIVGPDGIELCRVLTEKQAHPPLNLVGALCGQTIADQLREGEIYINYVTSRVMKRDKLVVIPGIDITLDVDFSTDPPTATIQAEDPYHGGEITRLVVLENGHTVACEDGSCSFPIRKDTILLYWADSSYGDSSGKHKALIRVGRFPRVVGDGTYLGWSPADRVPGVWGTIPPEHLPTWLQNRPETNLYTDIPYYYLAGKTILSGSLGVPDCENMGINPYSGGYATQCGLEHAREAVSQQQNTYNDQILDASRESGVPPWILKGVIAQESQFWPDANGHYGEQGLYQLSRDGADTLLRWSGSTYIRYCSRQFEDCEILGYDNREDWEKQALISSVLEDTEDISLLGDVLTAKSAQVGKMIENYWAAANPADVLSYEALWKLTIINYHAGPEFIATVLQQVDQRRMGKNWASLGRVTWELNRSVHKYMRSVVRTCQGVEQAEGFRLIDD